MNRLWNALSILAKDEVFRKDLQIDSDIVQRAELAVAPIDLRPQPSIEALDKINKKFMAKGLNLSVYELSEVNRWLWEDKAKFDGKSMEALATYWKSLGAPSNPTTEFLEAAGALAIDSGLRFKFAQGTTTLAQNGFSGLSDGEEKGLRDALQTGKLADNKAKEFVALSWPGSHCLAVSSVYPNWIHLNV